MTKFAFPIFLLLMTVALGFGCATKKPDPFAGWKSIGGFTYNLDELRENLGHGRDINEIIDDAQKFIQTLPPNQSGANLGPFQLYEDGTGQHAVEFRDFIGPYTSVQYALFYDKENKRVKVIKLGKSQYMS